MLPRVVPCVTPVRDPDRAPRDAWRDVLEAKASPGLNANISAVQDIVETGVGDVELDMYSITTDALGRDARALMTDFRANFDRYLGMHSHYGFWPFDDDSRRRWETPDAVGAVMVFKMGGIAGIPLERGAVVVSCMDPTSFIFSTVTITGLLNPGDHPISGNRAFGVADNGDGSLTIFTKAANRRKADNLSYQVIGSDTMFRVGSKVWLRLMDNLSEVHKDASPREVVAYRRVEPYRAP